MLQQYKKKPKELENKLFEIINKTKQVIKESTINDILRPYT